jgi:uncharacterized membrane protein (UPF0127 family)
VTLAESFFARAVGLLARAPLNDNDSLWILHCGSIHTIGMRYAIDVVFLGEEDRVLRVAVAVQPLRMRMQRNARSVLEMHAGSAAQFGITTGSRLSTVRSSVACFS